VAKLRRAPAGGHDGGPLTPPFETSQSDAITICEGAMQISTLSASLLAAAMAAAPGLAQAAGTLTLVIGGGGLRWPAEICGEL
jgi:hypothetical protein